MKRARGVALVLLGAGLVLSSCGGRSAGVLGQDTGGGNADTTDVVPVGDGTGLTDGGTSLSGDSGPRTDLGPLPDLHLPDIPGCAATTTLAALQQDLDGVQCDPAVAFVNYDRTETFCGLIIVSPRMEASQNLYAYFVAQASGAWNGAQLTVPADLDGNYPIGTSLEVLAEPQEFYCMTQVKVLQQPEELGTADVPPAEEVAPETLTPGGTTGEPYEGTLVTLNDVHVASTTGWGFVLVEGDVEISDKLNLGLRPNRGCALESVTGVVTYSFEKYQIIPLSADAVVYDPAADCPAGLGSVTEIQSADASAQCATFAESGAVYPDGGGDLVFEGLVVTTPQVHISSNLSGYYVQDKNAPAPEWSGVLVGFFKDDDPRLGMGDEVTLRGDWQEYHCLTQISADFPDGGPPGLEKTGADTVPEPVTTDAVRLATEPAYAEPYEGVLVQVGPQVVAEVPSDANHWQVTFESGLKMEDDVAYHYGDYSFSVGLQIPSVIGVIAGSTYDEGEYFIEPRGSADIGNAKASMR